jgi:Fur family transcriptional regulator, ferric uptake regulator
MDTGHHPPGGDCCGAGADRAERALSLARAAGLRVTEARRSLVRILAQSRVPLAVEELHRKVGRQRADRVTLYRSLDAFERAGIVQRHPLEKGRALYALSPGAHHHHHVACRRCGTIERLAECDVAAVEAAARARGFTELSHVLEIQGVCPRCARG